MDTSMKMDVDQDHKDPLVAEDGNLQDAEEFQTEVDNLDVGASSSFDDSSLYVALPKEELERLEAGIGGSAALTFVGVGATVRKKETFFCELCNVQLNSRDTMRSHALGVRHQQEKANGLERLALGMLERELVIRQIPNPTPLRKKVPVRLQAKLRETSEPVVGLEAVAEFIPISNKEMEPYYQCHLCGNMGEANGMFNHVLRQKHQEAFIDVKFPHDRRFVDLKTSDYRQLAQRFDERELLKSYPARLVRTYESDLMYPWSQGKAPWAVEQGGDGQVPDNARENVGKHTVEDWKTEQRFSIWRKLEADKQSAMKLIRCNLSDPSHIPDLKSPYGIRVDAVWMYKLNCELEKFAVKCEEKKVADGDFKIDRRAVARKSVDAKLNAELAKMSALMVSMAMKKKGGVVDGAGDAGRERKDRSKREERHHSRRRR